MATAQKYNLLSFNQTLELIMMPNEDCNFRCVYCYEDFVKSEMKETVQKGILKYLEKTYSLIIGPLIGSTLIISIGFTGVFLFCMAMLLISSLLIACVTGSAYDLFVQNVCSSRAYYAVLPGRRRARL